MKVVLDTSAIIYLNDFRQFDELLTVQEVADEVKDKISSMKLSSMNLKIVEPAKKILNEIKATAKETGDLEKLSKTDIKVLAAAKENGCTIISDDYTIQNVAEKLGMDYISIFSKKIERLISWKRYCKSCKRFFENEKECPRCGSKLVRVSEKSAKI